MDAATAAAMSDPERNRHFRRRWQDPQAPRTEPADRHASRDADPLGPIGHELLEAWRRQQRRMPEGDPR